MKVRPLRDKVIIQELDKEERKGLIYLPDEAKKRTFRGKVLAKGAGKRLKNGKRKKVEFEIGDEIYFYKYAGAEHKIDGKDCLIIDDSDVFAVIGNNANPNRSAGKMSVNYKT